MKFLQKGTLFSNGFKSNFLKKVSETLLISNSYRVKKYGIIVLLVTISTLAKSQTKGLIFQPATSGAGRLVLDPNADGFISTSSTGYLRNESQKDNTNPGIPIVSIYISDDLILLY